MLQLGAGRPADLQHAEMAQKLRDLLPAHIKGNNSNLREEKIGGHPVHFGAGAFVDSMPFVSGWILAGSPIHGSAIQHLPHHTHHTTAAIAAVKF